MFSLLVFTIQKAYIYPAITLYKITTVPIQIQERWIQMICDCIVIQRQMSCNNFAECEKENEWSDRVYLDFFCATVG